MQLVMPTEAHESHDWREPFLDYLIPGRLPEDRAKWIEIKRQAINFIVWKNELYRRSLDEIFLRCIAKEQVQEAMNEYMVEHAEPTKPG